MCGRFAATRRLRGQRFPLMHAFAPTSISRADFPPDFRWGCATSAYQIEGAVAQGGRGESIWDRFTRIPGRVRDGSNGDVTCNHYHLWAEDLDLAAAIGLNAYRFSIAWPRVLPRGRGAANQDGLDFYSRLVDGMLARGLEPWATLYHWDLPQALQEDGGWATRASIAAFEEYADVITRALGDRVRHWITHNEPWCIGMHGHHDGTHAPGVKNWGTALRVCHHVLVSHGRALRVIRANVPNARAGIVLSLHPISPASDHASDVAAAARYDGLRNRWFLGPLHGQGYPEDVWPLVVNDAPPVLEGDLDTIAARNDFLGINYYFPEVVAYAAGAGPLDTRVVMATQVERTAIGWEVAPAALVRLLTRVSADYRPTDIVITENGATYDDVPDASGTINDVERRDFILRHLDALRQAIGCGIPVSGYFVWSLMDNFEWAEGYTRRFGLVHVDFGTQRRRMKRSGHWYTEFLRQPRAALDSVPSPDAEPPEETGPSCDHLD
jgi:beta-glucosidase